MKKCISLFILALAASAACGKIESEIVTPAETGLVPLTFTGLTDGTLTKTSLNSNFQIVWSTSDVINVFDGSGSGPENFNVTSVARDGLEATFSGSAAASSTYYAISPASAGGAYVSAGTMTTMLPATQTATAGSFDPAAALSVAQASDYQFQFKNVGALVGVTLGNDGITGITLEAIGGEVLAGTVEVNADGTLNSKTGDAYVQMTGTFAKDATYYFVVLPGTYASGLRVTLQKGSEYARFNMTASQTIGRNDNLTLGTLTGSKWKTAFAVGEDVQIKGSAEEGQGLAYVGASGYWNESIQYSDVAGYAYNYEIFTRLTAGQKFYFMADGGEKFSLNAAGDAVGHLANTADAAYGAPADGIYRIRLSLPSGAAEVKQISEVKYDIYGLDSRVLDYQGNGEWAKDDFLMRTSSYMNRYRFLVKFSDNTKQYYGRMSADTGNPVYGTTPADYFFVQPTIDSEADHWAPCFKYPSSYENIDSRFYCTMTLSFNNVYGHYTHEITNIIDNQPAIPANDAITIQGAGANEAGQQMRYSTAFFNGDVTNSGDLTAVASPAGFDYEIFTKLSRGKFHFRTSGGQLLSLNAAGNAIVGITDATEAPYAGSSENNRVYRIRIKSTTREASIQRIWQAHYLQPDRGTNANLEYQSNGVWTGNVSFGWTHPNSWGNSERFKFKFQIFFDEAGVWQYYGRYETAADYTSTHIQPITDENTLSSWNNFLTVENDPVLGIADYQVDYGYCTLSLKLNSDGYTYEISNIRQ